MLGYRRDRRYRRIRRRCGVPSSAGTMLIDPSSSSVASFICPTRSRPCCRRAASASPTSMPWRANSAVSHCPSRPIVVALNSRIRRTKGIADAGHGDEAIEHEDRDQDDRPAGDRLVRPGHGRLERVRDEQHHRKVEQGELADLALPGQPQRAEEQHVDERGPRHQLQRIDAKVPHRIALQVLRHAAGAPAAGSALRRFDAHGGSRPRGARARRRVDATAQHASMREDSSSLCGAGLLGS